LVSTAKKNPHPQFILPNLATLGNIMGSEFFMTALLYTVHVLISLLLIGGILLQPGAKGGGMGSVFGGGGANSAFGARGAAPILAKLTYWLAASFMAACIAIEIFIIQQGRSVLDRGPSLAPPVAEQTEAEQTPAGTVPEEAAK
jgi:preprotein translocase subunit SecG